MAADNSRRVLLVLLCSVINSCFRICTVSGQYSLSTSCQVTTSCLSLEAVDYGQNNSYVKAVGTSPLRSNKYTQLIAVSTALRSHNVRSTAVEEQLKQNVKADTYTQRSPTSTAQLHLPALDFLISPGHATDCPALHESPVHLAPLDLAWTFVRRNL